MGAGVQARGWPATRAALAPGLRRVLAWATLAVAVVAIVGPALATTVARGRYTDFAWYGDSVARTAQSGRFETPHVLYPALLLALNAGRERPDWVGPGVHLALACEVVLAVLLAWTLERAMPGGRTVAPFAAAALALALMVVGPVSLSSWSEQNLYLGYIGLNPRHNPTLLLLRPLALAQWLLIARALVATDGRASLGTVGVLGGLSVAGVVAKPSYAVALLPALALVAGWRIVRHRPLDRRALLLGFAIPTLAILAWQYSFAYGGGAAAVVWAPLQVMGAFPGSPLRLPLSIVYPAVVTVVFFAAARRQPALALAWAAFLCGAGYAYLLAESGGRQAHGNLLWSAEVTLFLLFVASTAFLLREGFAPRPGRILRLAACAGAFSLHLLCGVHFLRHPTWF